MIRLNFDTKEKEIEELRKEYLIADDITLKLLGEDEVASKLGNGNFLTWFQVAHSTLLCSNVGESGFESRST